VRVSRAFTWQQYQALLERAVAGEAERTGAKWVVALGPLDLLADEEAKPFQAFRGARRVADALETLARAGLGVVAAQDERRLARAGRAELLDRLRPACRREFRVEAARKVMSDEGGVMSEEKRSLEETQMDFWFGGK
jgi:hypothetical protein